MDLRAPCLLLFAIGLGYWTWSANRSGKVTMRWSVVYRDKQPRLFAANLWGQAILAVGAVILAALVALGFAP